MKNGNQQEAAMESFGFLIVEKQEIVYAKYLNFILPPAGRAYIQELR
jgi:hypothetical protein